MSEVIKFIMKIPILSTIIAILTTIYLNILMRIFKIDKGDDEWLKK